MSLSLGFSFLYFKSKIVICSWRGDSHKKLRDAQWKIQIKPLKGTNVGVD